MNSPLYASFLSLTLSLGQSLELLTIYPTPWSAEFKLSILFLFDPEKLSVVPYKAAFAENIVSLGLSRSYVPEYMIVLQTLLSPLYISLP